MKSILLILLLSIFSVQPILKYKSPPLTKKLQDDIFMMIKETRNIDYLEFLYSIHDTIERKKYYPDVNIWLKAYNSETKSNLAFKDANYFHYPVVGISYNQAVSYSKWLSNNVTEKYGHGKFIYTYRLPEGNEWILMARNTSSNKIVNELSPYKSKLKTKRFLHVFDNVSEMLNQKNAAMGSNWVFTVEDIEKSVEYKNPQPWLGFRLICEVKAVN